MYNWHTYCKNGQKGFNPQKLLADYPEKRKWEDSNLSDTVVEILISHQILILSNLKENV